MIEITNALERKIPRRAPVARAIQFAPYQSLHGYEEMVRETEFVPDRQIELSDEEIAELSNRFGQLRKGMTVTVTYYRRDRYVTLSDTVAAVDEIAQTLRLARSDVPFRSVKNISVWRI